MLLGYVSVWPVEIFWIVLVLWTVVCLVGVEMPSSHHYVGCGDFMFGVGLFP